MTETLEKPVKTGSKPKGKTARIVAFYNRKGGVGKSSLCLLTARYLSRTGKRVLCVDLDPQKTLTNHLARLNEITPNGGEKNAFGLLIEKRSLDEVLLHVSAYLDLIPGSYDLSEVQANTTIYAVEAALAAHLPDYDYVLLDNAPNWTALIQSALHAADLVVIPALPAVEDLEQAEWSLSRASKVTKAERRVVLNQFSSERPGSQMRQLLDHYAPAFESFLLDASIPRSGLVRRYTGTGETITRVARIKAEFLEKFGAFVRESLGEFETPEAF